MRSKNIINTNIVILFIYLSSYILPPATIWVLTYAIVGMAILIGAKKVFQYAMRLVWNVQVEPPATDVLLITSYIKYVIQHRKIPIIKNTYITLILVFIFISVIQVYWATNTISAIIFNIITIYIIYIYPYIIYIYGKKYGLRYVIEPLLYAVVLTAASIIVAAIANALGYGEQFPWLYYVSNRPRGFFKDANVAGPFVVVGVLYILSKILVRKKYSKVDIIYTLIMITAVILTFSRGALLNMAIGVFVIAYLTLLHKRGLRLLVVLLLLAVPTAVYFQYALSAFGQNRVIEINYYDVQGRLGAWKSGLLMSRDYPLGVGPGQFEQHAIDYQSKYIKNAIPTKSAHNTYIRLLAENSALGLLLFIMATWYVVTSITRKANKLIRIGDIRTATTSVWVVSVLVGVLAEGMVVDVLHWRHLGIMLGIGLLIIDGS